MTRIRSRLHRKTGRVLYAKIGLLLVIYNFPREKEIKKKKLRRSPFEIYRSFNWLI